MGIITKTGDDGKSRFGGRVVSKNGRLLRTLGALDELQAAVMVVRCDSDGKMKSEFEKIEKDLWGIMGEIGYGEKYIELESRVVQVEEMILEIEKSVVKVMRFVTFVKKEAVMINWVRTVARRAERELIGLSKLVDVNSNIRIYLNRLSDYFFVEALEAER